MLHDAAPARLSAHFVSCSFVPPYLSQPPARGIYRLWDRYQPPLARLSHSRQRRGLQGSRVPQESPSSQWEAVAGVAYRPRCHRARCCHALGQRLRRSLGQPPVPKDGRSVVMAARLSSLGFSAARGLC